MRRDVIDRLGRVAAAMVTVATGIGIAWGAGQLIGSSGHALVVAFLLVAPALAITRLVPGAGVLAGLIVGAAGAIVINILVALSMLSTGSWSSGTGIVVVGFISALIRLVPVAESPDGESPRRNRGHPIHHLKTKGMNT